MPALETSANVGILCMTLNRREAHNAFDPEMVARLAEPYSDERIT